MRTRKKLGIAAASLAAAAMVSAGLIAGSSNAFADPTASPTPGSSTKPAEQRTAAPSDGSSAGTGRGGRQGDPGGTHTEVTGTEAEKVTAAVTAQQSGVTVTKVMKDADGSYDVAAMCRSWNAVSSEEPRCPEVPKTTISSGFAGSGVRS